MRMTMLKKAAGFALVLVAFVAMPLQAQEAALDDDYDLAVGIPQPKWVGEVNEAEGLVELDGQMYRLARGKALAKVADQGKRLSLADLEPGMQVLAATDGTQAERGRVPFVLAIWQID